MSRIVPKLNLNKTPQLVENNSLIMAKNIRLLEDGTIGPDTSLEEIETKTGSSSQHVVHHDAVVEEITTYEYTILNVNTTINYVKNHVSPDPSNLEPVSFNFFGYCPPGTQEDRAIHDVVKFTRVGSTTACTIYCYKQSNDYGVTHDVTWSHERFIYNQNDNMLKNTAGYCLFLAIRSDIYNNTTPPQVSGIADYYFIILPKNSLGSTYNINKFDYIIVNPVFPTTTVETKTITPAYDETITQYDTMRYIGQIVGLNNKIYFFKEEHSFQDSTEVRDAIHAKYVDECFVDDKIPAGRTVTFSVNSENYITRRGLLFEDREIAEEIEHNPSNRVKIYEYDEITKEFKVVRCGWKYSGGKINGCVTVNSTGEPILTICEYDLPNDKLVPIKHINLARCKANDNESFYTQAPNIPLSNIINVRRYTKTIPSGVYQFFIRYKIHDGFYTTWFLCSKELYAGRIKQIDTLQGSLKYTDLHEDSNLSFAFNVEHLFKEFCGRFEEFQLGFIISSEGGVFARSWKHFNMTSTKMPLIYFDYNQEDVEEINIDDLLKTNYDIFNVGNITPYKNKLYIGNYTETDFNESLNGYAKDIKVKLKLEKVESDGGYSYYFDGSILHESDTPNCYDTFGTTEIKTTFRDNYYCDISTSTEHSVNTPETYYYLEDPEYASQDYIDEHYHDKITKIYITYNNTRYFLLGGIYAEGDEAMPSYDNNVIIDNIIDRIKDVIIGVDSDGNYIARINGTDIYLDSYSIEYKTYDKEYVQDWYDPGVPNTSWQWCDGIKITTHTNKITENISLKSTIITSTSTYNYKEYNTLLPFTKYDFYIHFVKQNGIATNGYFIGTKEIERYCAGYIQSSRVPAIGTVPFSQISATDDLTDISFYKPSHEDYAYYIDPTSGDTVTFYMGDISVDDKYIIYPSFENIKCPPGYVGCFISISKYGYNVSEGFNYATDPKNEKHLLDCLELDCLLYNTHNDIIIKNSSGVEITTKAKYYSSSATDPVHKLGCSGHIEFNTPGGHSYEDEKLWVIFNATNRPYHKTLIKLTPYIKLGSNPTSYEDYDNVNSPGYFCEVMKLDRTFCDAKLADNSDNPTGYYVSGNDIYTRDINNFGIDLEEVEGRVGFHISSHNYILSNFNLNYVSLTHDLAPIVRSYSDDSSNPPTTKQQFITLVDSLICSFILELKSYYKDYTRKVYYEYTKNKFTRFDNTIRVSSIDVDEIYRYIYRFESTDYYNVPTQRGIITNLVAVANTLYVHCEHSLFKFSDNKSLNAQDEEVSLQENDIFNSGISEVFDAQYGYAGLKTREHSLVTYNAYIFYDDVAKTIYAFGGEQQIGSISEPIKKLIDTIVPTDVIFVADELNNRFFVNLKNKNGNICLSFNFNSKSFVSVHDLDFSVGFHSRRYTYFIHENMYDGYAMGWSIYRVVNAIRVSANRTDTPDPSGDEPLLDSTINYIAYQACYKPSLVFIEDCDKNVILNEVNSANACIDVIVNTQYETIKALNYISWICSEIKNYGRALNTVSEEMLDRRYPGTKIRIYSDSTQTNLLDLLDSTGNPKIANENRNIDINGNPSPNSKNWRYIQYNCGVWSMNYFRDIKNSIPFNVNADIFEYTDGDNNIGGNPGDSETTDLSPYINREYLTQENSLLYGKYFVVRFIFNNKNFKIENLILRMNDYGKTK